jgi:hypothetical protein
MKLRSKHAFPLREVTHLQRACATAVQSGEEGVAQQLGAGTPPRRKQLTIITGGKKAIGPGL